MRDEADLTASRPNLLRAWWPAFVWTGLISFESTDFFSSQNTGSLLYALLTRLFGEIDLYDFLIFHHYLRKTGHVVGYGILSLLLLRGWRRTLVRARAALDPAAAAGQGWCPAKTSSSPATTRRPHEPLSLIHI